jgi:hypothetical protein
MARHRDRIWIECERGAFDRFQHLELSTDVFGEAQCWFTVADDRAWRTLRPLLAPGREFRVFCDGLVHFTGRVECTELPSSCDGGTSIQVVLRTRMADARISGADPAVRVADTTIRRFLLALYARHGLTEADFQFSPDADRDLVTGRKKGARDPVDLDALPAEKAKVAPTETTYEAAKRHLERHHLLHWDAASGLICVGLPDDRQPPSYRFEQRRGACNFLAAHPVRDWGDVPGEIWIYGGGVGKDVLRAPVKGVAVDLDLAIESASTGHFTRRVILAVEGAKDQARADAQAKRELAARSRRKAAWSIDVDGWSYWDGTRATPYAIDTTADVDVETHEGTELRGVFLVTSVRKSLDAEDGARATLTLLAKGLIDPVRAGA